MNKIDIAIALRSVIWKVESIAIKAHEAIDPTPILIKEGLFKKARVVCYRPFNRYFVDYVGDKKPINDKPIWIH